MPQFENLDPFINPGKPDKPRFTPIAPHSSSRMDYRPRNRPERRSPAKKPKGLQPAPIEFEVVDSREMERAFRKADRALRKEQRASQPGPLRRLLKRLRRWWRVKTAKLFQRDPRQRQKAKGGPGTEPSGSERDQRRGQRQGRRGSGRKGGDRQRNDGGAQGHPSGGQQADSQRRGNGGGKSRKRRSGSRGDRGPDGNPNRQSPHNPQGGEKPSANAPSASAPNRRQRGDSSQGGGHSHGNASPGDKPPGSANRNRRRRNRKGTGEGPNLNPGGLPPRDRSDT